jgi:hypothetical protein
MITWCLPPDGAPDGWPWSVVWPHPGSASRANRLAMILQRGDDNPVAEAVGVVIVFVLLARFTLKGKGAPAARLASLLAVIITLWLFVAVTNPPAAGDVASAAASWTSAAITGLGRFIADVFS